MTLEDESLVIHSSFELTVTEGGFDPELGSTNEHDYGIIVYCEGPSLPAGNYDVQHGEASLALPVPGTVHEVEACLE